ncbi:flagellar export chaperone FliS [uncultured Nocardioides sp.]|uniref:Flagellar biosynthesis protein FliS n=1 Tax=uncultured Nocardioides sp. TaxID=198441 RepID=A0A6J4MZK3_9ACTN|nr:flagellar export chaperone FliS [uncultured Nocardioides sp.]CAA9373509.1 MAG: Flagellar biosynthesis protein FliS [uncultured Nocardioides sp.]
MNPNARAAYLDASIATASPARLLVMLFDRLRLDISRALEAQHGGDHQAAHGQLLHAQDIVMELRVSLKPELFDAGPALAGLYDFLHGHLVQANVRRDPTLTEQCLKIAGDLGDTWREAAMQQALSA